MFIQWVAPIVSEFPEMASTVYFARTPDRAPMALMNMVSSNINQWTLLVAMLPIVFSISVGHATAIVLDSEQRLQLLMTLGQALVGMMFLINMQLAWWEAAALLVLFIIPVRHRRCGEVRDRSLLSLGRHRAHAHDAGKTQPTALDPLHRSDSDSTSNGPDA